MSIFNRFWDLFRGKTNAFLDKIENPADQLSVVIEDLNKQLRLQHQSVAKAMADEKKLRMDLDDLIQQSLDWENKAVYALKSGDEDLARQALLRKEEVKTKAVSLEKIWVQQKEATDKLKISLQNSKGRIEDTKRQYTLLTAQYQTAMSKKKINNSISSMSEDSSSAKIEKLKDKIQQLEAESEAELLLGSTEHNSDLDQRFKVLDSNIKIDLAMEQLKAKIAAPNSPEKSRDVTYSTPSKKVGNG